MPSAIVWHPFQSDIWRLVCSMEISSLSASPLPAAPSIYHHDPSPRQPTPPKNPTAFPLLRGPTSQNPGPIFASSPATASPPATPMRLQILLFAAICLSLTPLPPALSATPEPSTPADHLDGTLTCFPLRPSGDNRQTCDRICASRGVNCVAVTPNRGQRTHIDCGDLITSDGGIDCFCCWPLE